MTIFCYSLCSSHVRNTWFGQGWSHNKVMCINHRWHLAGLWETANCLWAFTLIIFWPGVDWPLWSRKWGMMHIYRRFLWKEAGKSWLPRNFYKTFKKTPLLQNTAMVNSSHLPAMFSLLHSLNGKCAWHDACIGLKPPQLFDFSVHGLMQLSIGIGSSSFASAVTWISYQP